MFQVLRNIVLLLAFGGLAYAGVVTLGPDLGIGESKTIMVDRNAAAPKSNASFSREIELEPGPNGQFWVTAEIDGVEVRFLIDTGASHVVLSPEDAENLGYESELLDYSQIFQTANGYTRAAPVVLDGIRIGQLEVDNVKAAVNESRMGASLLGMTFLRQLDGYQVEDGRLILYW